MLKPDFHPQLCSLVYTTHAIKAQILISCPKVFGGVPLVNLCSGGLRRSPPPNWPELESKCASGRQEPTRLEPIEMETQKIQMPFFLPPQCSSVGNLQSNIFLSLSFVNRSDRTVFKRTFYPLALRINPILDIQHLDRFFQ